MAARIDYPRQSPELFRKLVALSTAGKASGPDAAILNLVDIRASQLNGCGFCLDMHVKEAKIRGERELRLHHVAIWRESSLFDARERAALAWTEALTRLAEQGIADADFAAAREQFPEKELSDLTFAVATINTWNRLNIAFRNPPGSADEAFCLQRAGLS